MKKTMTLTLSLLIISLLLAACGSTTTSDKTNNDKEEQIVSDTVEEGSLIELTLEELAQYNGQNGQPAYVAVDGIIYDMTDSGPWKNGQHNGFEAGKDLTEAINTVSPHGPSKLENVPVIGRLITKEAKEESNLIPKEPTRVVAEPEPQVTEEPEPAPVAAEPETQVIEEPEPVPVATEPEPQVTEEPEPAPVVEEAQPPVTEAPETKEEPAPESEPATTLLQLTLVELSVYNGKDGMPAYIAVDDVIYDVSHLEPWSGGEHNGNYAGLDLTDDLNYAPHGPEKLKKAIIVGELVK